MTSQILQEGILDVKAPKGSDERKLWKAWRCQWASFSVVYPSGRKEPYLVLELSNSTSKNSNRRISVSRDGLRLFRCTSKSRPFRTWAIMSGEKPLLYFAAESEIRAQQWMQLLRDGLWPPCFSFQMLTACSHEVSLIDDENTYLAGHLGVYGRLVLTSEDVISLMHPHWGAALLQISLINIKDVLLVRESEIPPAGVFSIVLKGVEGSKVRALYFYSVTAVEAIQWILSKVISKSVSRSKELLEKRKLSKSNSDRVSSADMYLLVDVEDGHVNNSASTAQLCIGKNHMDKRVSLMDINDEYKNLISLEDSVQNPFGSSTVVLNNSVNSNSYAKVEEQTSKETLEQNIAIQTSKAERLVNLSANSDVLKNNISVCNLSTSVFLKDFKQEKKLTSETKISYIDESRHSSNSDSSNSDSEHLKILNKNSIQTKYLAEHINDELHSIKYATVNKRNMEDLPEQNTSEKTARNSLLKDGININENNSPSIINQRNSNIANITLSTSNIEYNNKKTALPFSTSINEINVSSSIDDRSNEFSMKCPKGTNGSEIHCKISMSSNTYSSRYGKKDSHGQITQSLTNGCHVDNKAKIENSDFFMNIPSDFLNTSISSVRFNNKNRESSSSDEDLGSSMPWPSAEFLNFDDSDNHVYEDLLERKGTIYEEMNDSDSDEIIPHIPPLLPDRPKNLEIPTSLRLKKLSESIKETLNFAETPQRTKKYNNPNLIKKIEEINRVMRIN